MPKLTPVAQERRRARILDAAEACFARSGFHRTTMVDICREAKISAGALYVYFSSKEALIDGLVERDREESVVMLDAVGEAPDFFAAMAGALRSCVVERPAHKAALFIEIVAEARRNPHVASSLAACDARLRGMLAAIVGKARVAGHVAPDADPDKLAMVMMLIGDALFMRRAVNPAFDAEAILPELLQMMRNLMSGAAMSVLPPAAAVPSTHALGAVR